MNKWDQRFLDLAKFISTWSKDPSTKCGSVIIDEDRRIVSIGYNGLPKNIEDTYERLHDRALKYQLVCHAERNAIQFAQRSLKGCIMYNYPFMPCSVCAGLVIQSGIKACVSYNSDCPRWKESFELTKKLFEEANIKLELFNE